MTIREGTTTDSRLRLKQQMSGPPDISHSFKPNSCFLRSSAVTVIIVQHHSSPYRLHHNLSRLNHSHRSLDIFLSFVNSDDSRRASLALGPPSMHITAYLPKFASLDHLGLTHTFFNVTPADLLLATMPKRIRQDVVDKFSAAKISTKGGNPEHMGNSRKAAFCNSDCCSVCCLPFFSFGKTSYRLEQLQYGGNPLDLEGYSACNEGCFGCCIISFLPPCESPSSH